jgi:signal transduction histidine kinase
MSESPTPRLLLGLAVTLIAVVVFAWFSLRQISGLRQIQTNTIDRNRRDSLQLLRIQDDLNSLGLAMRDMVQGEEPYGLEAWRGEFQRIREDLRDALDIENRLSSRPPEQTKYLATSVAQFWRSADEMFAVAPSDPARARRLIANTLQAQQAAMSSTVARLLVHNNEAEEQSFAAIEQIYKAVERNVYLFVAAMMIAIVATSSAMIYFNRKIFNHVASLSEQRSTLARKLITIQEDVLRSVSRELHDEFGQILTAVSAMLTRAEKKGVPPDSPLRTELAEVREIVQDALQKVRGLSQALHPTVLDDYGLEKAMERFVPTFEKQTGIDVEYTKEGSAEVPDLQAIHVYRVLQEALNNVARHSNAKAAWVRVQFGPERLKLEIEDHGVGLQTDGNGRHGLGLVAMRERAELLHGTLVLTRPPEGGTRVTLSVPLTTAVEKA